MALYRDSFFTVVDRTLLNVLQPAHSSVKYRRIVITTKYGMFYVIWYRHPASYPRDVWNMNYTFHISCYLRCSVVICVVLCIVCKCVLPPGDNPIAVNKYIISYHHIILYHILYHIISYHIESYYILYHIIYN